MRILKDGGTPFITAQQVVLVVFVICYILDDTLYSPSFIGTLKASLTLRNILFYFFLLRMRDIVIFRLEVKNFSSILD